MLSKSMPTLMHGLEACRLNKSDIRSLDFVVNRLFMKICKTNNMAMPATVLVQTAQRPDCLALKEIGTWQGYFNN